MKTGTPFGRAIALAVMIGEIMKIGDANARRLALGTVSPYQSRGKGKGIFSGRYDARKLRQGGRSKYKPHQGAQECARRALQQFGKSVTHHAYQGGGSVFRSARDGKPVKLGDFSDLRMSIKGEGECEKRS